MSRHTVFILLFFAVVKASHSLSSTIEVISGVFVTPETDVGYLNATNVCKLYDNSTAASLENVNVSLQNGFEKCTWGWVNEGKLVMPRRTPNEKCARGAQGFVIRNCAAVNASYVICIKRNGTSASLYEASLGNLNSSFVNANLTCLSNGDKIASWNDITDTSNNSLTFNRTSWYNYGVAVLDTSGTYLNVSCYYETQEAVYCYNPNLPDNNIKANNMTWKRIAVACVLGSIFVILLLAGLFMKGNQCICCVKDRPAVETDFPAEIPVPAPKWNKTSVYVPIRKGSKYVNISDVMIEKRPPIIRPDSSYKIHTYTNMGYDKTAEER